MEPTLFSIGEFSKVTGLSVKTLRFYQEKDILTPSRIDGESGYRYYDQTKIEQARIIVNLRAMEFSIEEISVILKECGDERDVLAALRQKKAQIEQRIRRDRDVAACLDRIIAKETEAQRLVEQSAFAVENKSLEPMLMAGIRMKGKYSDCGKGFSQLARALGRHIAGKCFCLYYDGEFRDEDADFEACFPLRKEVSAEGVSVRTLTGGRVLSLIHKGPYDQLGRSYAKILRDAKERKLELQLPTREVYLKGPGMIFKGNAKNYLTEIQLPFTAGT
jgi:DNA-binding transcriptional MerR regulator/effector-binding domain-containing protein